MFSRQPDSGTAGVTFNGGSRSLPVLNAPVAIEMARVSTHSDVIVFATTPYFSLPLESTPDLLLADWTPISTTTPVDALCAFTNDSLLPIPTHHFYRAFVTAYTDVP